MQRGKCEHIHGCSQRSCHVRPCGVGVEDRIFTIRLNRPEKKNALTFALYAAMTEALAKTDGDPGVCVVLITGTPDCFTAGNDLADFAAAKPGQVSPAVRCTAILYTPLRARVFSFRS